MGQIKNIKLHIVTDIKVIYIFSCKMAVNGHAVNGALEGVSNLSISNGPAVGTKTGADYKTGTFKVKSGMAQMAKGGIIMDVVNAEQARIAENAGACAVMALERVPFDIRKDGGIARMSDPKMIKEIIDAVSIPVMAKSRIGHFAESQVLQALGVDMIDESEVLTPADHENHINKHDFKVPFVCGAKDLGEALRRISEGAAMNSTELYAYAKELRVPYDLLATTAKQGRLPVVNFAAGGLATPADVSLLMQLGVDGVFVGSGIFKSENPTPRAKAMAEAVTYYNDPAKIAELSTNLGKAMSGPHDKNNDKW